jgi:hypothetical protein
VRPQSAKRPPPPRTGSGYDSPPPRRTSATTPGETTHVRIANAIISNEAHNARPTPPGPKSRMSPFRPQAANGPLMELLTYSTDPMTVGVALLRLRRINGHRTVVLMILMMTDDRPMVRAIMTTELERSRLPTPPGSDAPDRFPYARWRSDGTYPEFRLGNDMQDRREFQIRCLDWLIKNRPDILADQLPASRLGPEKGPEKVSGTSNEE